MPAVQVFAGTTELTNTSVVTSFVATNNRRPTPHLEADAIIDALTQLVDQGGELSRREGA